MNQLKVWILITSSCCSLPIFSATDGTFGSSSTGTVLVSIVIPGIVQISGLQDINLGSPSTYPVTGLTSACIYSNVVSPVGAYYVKATSSHPTGAGDFQVSNGTFSFIYSAFWNDASGTTPGGLQLTSAVETSQLSGGNNQSTNCGGIANANFNVQFDEAQIQSAPPSATAYTDQVTILITPVP